MTMRQTVVLILVCLPVLLAAECGRDPQRPRVSRAEIASPAYDRFFEHFGAVPANRHDGTVLRRGASIIYAEGEELLTGAAPSPFKGGAAAFVEIDHLPGTAGMTVLVVYNANPATDPPAMQLQLMARRDLENGDFIGEVGDPLVLSDLSTAQAEQVLQDGVPDSLIEAMVQAALDAGWRPATPSPHQFGRIIHVWPEEYLDRLKDEE